MNSNTTRQIAVAPGRHVGDATLNTAFADRLEAVVLAGGDTVAERLADLRQFVERLELRERPLSATGVNPVKVAYAAARDLVFPPGIEFGGWADQKVEGATMRIEMSVRALQPETEHHIVYYVRTDQTSQSYLYAQVQRWLLEEAAHLLS